MATKSADDFYCKMGMLSGELLNGHLFDSNGLIQKVVDLGPIPELQKLRDKHLYNITPWRDKRGLKYVICEILALVLYTKWDNFFLEYSYLTMMVILTMIHLS